jgi:hypothetical protein
MSKASVAAEKALYDGLTKGEAGAFFLMRRYWGGEMKYKSVRRYKTRFIEEGLLTEAGKLPEPPCPYGGPEDTSSEARERLNAQHDARFTEKGHALYKKLCTMELGDAGLLPKTEADELEARIAHCTDLRTRMHAKIAKFPDERDFILKEVANLDESIANCTKRLAEVRAEAPS